MVGDTVLFTRTLAFPCMGKLEREKPRTLASENCNGSHAISADGPAVKLFVLCRPAELACMKDPAEPEQLTTALV